MDLCHSRRLLPKCQQQKIVSTMSRLRGIAGEANGAGSAATHVTIKDASQTAKGASNGTPSYTTFLWPLTGLLWERKMEEILIQESWEQVIAGEVFISIEKPNCSCQYTLTISKR